MYELLVKGCGTIVFWYTATIKIVNNLIIVLLILQGVALILRNPILQFLAFLSYVAADLRGEIIRTKGLAKYVGRVREKNRSHRRHSDFYLGLHAAAFVESFLIFADVLKH